MKPNLDGQKSRSQVTQQGLMLAAEKLIAEKGIHQVSIREIVKEAGQKNESALQYHFTNLQGLLKAIHVSRNQQIREKRSEVLRALLVNDHQLDIRDICRIMVLPAFSLAKADSKFRRYMAAFAFQITQDDEPLELLNHSRDAQDLIRSSLAHLKDDEYHQRMEFAVRLCSSAMGTLAKQKNAFKGPSADHYMSQLLDALEGLLTAPASEESRAY